MDEIEKNSPETAPSQFIELISWEAPEYEHYEKSREWYWAVGIVTLAFFAVAIILQNFLFAILVLISGFSFALYGARQPRTISFAITSRGIKIDKSLYPFNTLDHFWVNYDPPLIREIYVISKKIFVPQISIPLGDAEPNNIRDYLIKFIEQNEIEEPFAHIIVRFFGF